MTKKIDEAILKKVKLLCYDVLECQQIDRQARTNARDITRQYLDSKGYKILNVICDETNNPCSVIDQNQIIIDIQEENIPGHASYIKHRITL